MKTTKITSKCLLKAELESLNKGQITKTHKTFSGAVNYVKRHADGGCGIVYYAGEAWCVNTDFDINIALSLNTVEHKKYDHAKKYTA